MPRLSERTVNTYRESGIDKHRTDYVQSDGLHPLTTGWRRYHPNEATIEVIDMDGKRRYLTPKQHHVLLTVRTLRDRASMTMIAASLGYATSTVSRALLRLASMGLVAYDVARGRYGGLTVLRASVVDMKRRAQTAWETLKRQRMQRERAWIARLERSGWSMLRPIRAMDATLTWIDPVDPEIDALAW